MQLQIGHQELDSATAVVTLAGRLMLGPEGAQLEALVKRLIAGGHRNIVLDFTGLTHIDSTGIGRCIASLNIAMQSKANLLIAGAAGQVREGFRVTQLDRVFRFYDDVAAARAALV